MIKENIRQMFGTGASSSKDYDILRSVIKTSLQNGICGFDTAPSYKTEKLLSKILQDLLPELGMNRDDVFIQTKIDAWQMQKGDGEVKSFVYDVMEQMNIGYIDSLLIHWPIPEYTEKTWETFLGFKDEKLVKNIGICNVRMRQLTEFKKWSFMPEIIQIERHPLMNFSDEIRFCKENNILIQAYSPLCKMDDRIANNDVLKALSQKYNKSVGQIVLRWHVDTGVVPVFTSTKSYRVKEYSQIYDFKLLKSEIEEINKININYKMYLEAWACPGF